MARFPAAEASHPFLPRMARVSPSFSLRLVFFAAAIVCPLTCSGDRAYAPSRDYDLQSLRTHLRFDLAQRAAIGEVTESLTIAADQTPELKFDCDDIAVAAVTVDGKEARFSTTVNQLIVALATPAHRGELHEVAIRYTSHPKAGLYFVLPDANYPNQPREVWTQGEAEDTHHYIPLYDYPNMRTKSEMILTVPASWTTVSNGRLVSVKDDADGNKTWDWKEELPISTYLISVVAGEFDEHEDAWRGIPLRYVVPHGRDAEITPTFARTKSMLDVFSEKLGVPYPWPQYAQSTVDNFVTGGMENATATTLPTSSLVHPALAAEYHIASDIVESHELAHQWFGDLVTCKDWANLWLNEGFATFFEHFWLEERYNADEADYEFWRDQQSWFRDTRLYPVPIVDRNFTDSTDFAGNIYTKGAWVLRMLRAQLGDADFFRALHEYLETNRGKNVVTADLERAIEQSTGVNDDRFFRQWVYRAGAPKFAVSYAYDDASHQVKLNVAQTQTVENLVGLFDVTADVEITTATGRKTYPLEINQANQAFSFLADGPPLMLLFDKGDRLLKNVDFKKPADMLIYQLKHADAVPDRADAVVALGQLKNDPAVAAALGEAARNDAFWGVRVEALRSLGRVGGDDAKDQLLASLSEKEPWVKEIAVLQLGRFREDASIAGKITEIAGSDSAYRVRAAALEALAEFRAPNAFDVLSAAVNADSPDDRLRAAALEAFARLGDGRAVPVLLEWSAVGKPYDDREAAIAGMASLDKQNKDITKALIAYLKEPNFDLQRTAVFALAERGDPSAIGPLEELLRSDTLLSDEKPHIQHAIELLNKLAKP